MLLVIIGRFLAVALAGYLVIAGLQTLFLEVLLGGSVEQGASAPVLLGGLAGTVVSGLLGGFVTAWLGGRLPLYSTGALLLFLLGDTVYVLATEDGTPWWFLLGGAGTLFFATALGGWIRARLRGLPGEWSEGAGANA